MLTFPSEVSCFACSSQCFSFMLLVFLKCLVISHSFEGLDCYILVTGLEPAAIVKVTIHLRCFFSEYGRAVQVNGQGCANRRIPIYESWIGYRLSQRLGKCLIRYKVLQRIELLCQDAFCVHILMVIPKLLGLFQLLYPKTKSTPGSVSVNKKYFIEKEIFTMYRVGEWLNCLAGLKLTSLLFTP